MIGPFTEDNIEMMILTVMVLTILIIFCILIKYFCRYKISTREMITEEVSLNNLRSE